MGLRKSKEQGLDPLPCQGCWERAASLFPTLEGCERERERKMWGQRWVLLTDFTLRCDLKVLPLLCSHDEVQTVFYALFIQFTT